MALFGCLSAIARRKKHNSRKNKNVLRTLVESSDQRDALNSDSFNLPLPYNVPKNSSSKVKVMSHDSPPVDGEGERDEKSTLNDPQEFQFQNLNANPSETFVAELDAHDHGDFDVIQSGHLSDPGTRAEHWASPKLKRSCSSLDTREVLKKMADQLPRTKSQLFVQLQGLAKRGNEDVTVGTPLSHTSAITHFSADKVMLKKRSSSQILPSRSRRLWWKLFLWSHRNLQKPKTRPVNDTSLNQLGGYSSDTLEPGRMKEIRRPETPESKNDDDKWTDHIFEGGGAGFWPQNQWLAFSVQSSPLQRVDEWVKDLQVQPSDLVNDGGRNGDENEIEFPPSPENDKSYPTMNLSADVMHANGVIKSLNSSSTVAHISGMGLKVIPDVSHFLRLRSVNLSNNSIVRISVGHLPKGLHMLDLSRNKINNIEGLRELTRLRVLNLSYNRISRIGHGLSKCVLLKELYLSGNKIGDVEGLHRLLKLAVLDLSFNKITTTKGLGQLVANYSSLLALNLLGNPVQSNLSEDQIRKAVCGLLPKLAYLNKQPINQQKAREVATDIVIKASSASADWNGRRKAVRKASHGGGSGSSSVGQRRKSKPKGRGHQQSNLRVRSPA